MEKCDRLSVWHGPRIAITFSDESKTDIEMLDKLGMRTRPMRIVVLKYQEWINEELSVIVEDWIKPVIQIAARGYQTIR